jgi:hypothetical protein
MQMAKNVEQILGDHVEGNNMTKWYQAINAVRTGIFVAKGDNGADLGLGYDMGRNVSQAITYDFTAGGETMSEALTNMSLQLDKTNTPKANRIAILGATWITEWSSDSGILEEMQANSANQLLAQDMFEKKFGNIEGLYVLGQYRPRGATSPFWILSYVPGFEYVAYKGASAVPFIPDTEAVALSLNDKTYSIKRGVDAFDDRGKVMRVVGDLVVDSYSENDPITTFIRSQTRHMYIYGNIDHTVKSVGTFS